VLVAVGRRQARLACDLKDGVGAQVLPRRDGVAVVFRVPRQTGGVVAPQLGAVERLIGHAACDDGVVVVDGLVVQDLCTSVAPGGGGASASPLAKGLAPSSAATRLDRSTDRPLHKPRPAQLLEWTDRRYISPVQCTYSNEQIDRQTRSKSADVQCRNRMPAFKKTPRPIDNDTARLPVH
jgi:hypothetical protein